MNSDSVNAGSADLSKKGSSLQTRIVSALILLPLVLAIVYLSYWTVALAAGIALVISLWELFGLIRYGGYRPRIAVGMATALGLLLAFTLQRFVAPFPLVELILTVAILGSLIYELFQPDYQTSLPSWGLSLASALYLGWLFSHFVSLRALEHPLTANAPLAFLQVPSGAVWIFVTFAITWMQDTCAYFVGRAFGRHKMAPILSPKKTWEGAAGGMLGAILGGVGACWLFGAPIPLMVGGLFGVIGGVIGPLGDLAESLIKRQVGSKDAGQLIPGHGGLLDRVDSLIFTAPVLYYLILLFLR
jgi:phosphatidate cytidylyltransferase